MLTFLLMRETNHFNCLVPCGKIYHVCLKFSFISWNFLSFLLHKRFPFDSNNLVGYLIAVILEYIMYGCDCFIIACTLALGVGAFWFAVSACKEIQHVLQSFNDVAHAKQHQLIELRILFVEFINTHLTVKQLSIFQFFNTYTRKGRAKRDT